MKKQQTNGTLSARAIAGTRVVLLGMNLEPSARKGLLGFAIRRTDLATGKEYWLPNFRVFKSSHEQDQERLALGADALASMEARAVTALWDPEPAEDEHLELVAATAEDLERVVPAPAARSRENPFQAFKWGDYQVEPGRRYGYEIVPMYGKPGALTPGDGVEIEVATESDGDAVHSVFFNRGVIASQRYAVLFGNKPPDEDPTGKAFTWLSRGLKEALLGFLDQARDGRWALRASLYEFYYPEVLEAFRAADERGADVRILYDCKKYKKGKNKGKPYWPGSKSLTAIKEAGIKALTVPRRKMATISHNKFIVLIEDGKPVQVWTGSTNISEGGIFGQSNVGHVIRDEGVAAAFLEYWTKLSEDTECKALKAWNDTNTPVDTDDERPPPLQPIFSPRGSLEALEYYGQLLSEARESVFLTAAFGVKDTFEKVLKKRASYLRYVLLESPGDNYTVINRHRGNRISVGNRIPDGGFGRWVKEIRSPLNNHVYYVHTKYLLVDALGEHPTVVTGSANFSDPSTTKNDENMLIIRDDPRVADIYLGEFMRLFTHYHFRAWVSSLKKKSRAAMERMAYLDETDAWAREFYVPGSPHAKERLLFSGGE